MERKMVKKSKKQQNSKVRTLLKKICGIFLIAAVVVLYVSLAGYNPQDPCLNQENHFTPTNFLGLFGANIADLVY